MTLLALALAPSATGCEAGGSGGTSEPQEYGSSAVANAPASAVAPARDPAQLAAFDEQARADLAADVLRRTEAARHKYGDDVPLRVESGLFVLVPAERGTPFDAAADLAQRGLDVFLGSFFERRPDRAVTVYVVHSATAFAALWAPYTAGYERGLGMYSREARDIVVNVGPGLPSILHELVHPLVQTDFPRAPSWLDEGIAALFEQPVFDAPGELHGARNWRDDRLAAALGSARLRGRVHLPMLFAVNDESIDEVDQDLVYSMARSLCEWLDGRGGGQLWPFYRAWRDAVAEDPSGERSFARVTGMTVEEADAEWVKWVVNSGSSGAGRSLRRR